MSSLDKRLKKISEYSYVLDTKYDLPISFCANDDVYIESNAIDELEGLISDLCYNVELFNREGLIHKSQIEKIVITPDFHKGSGVPIGTIIKTNGFIIPQAMGNDVNCGMRLIGTNITYDEIKSNIKDICNELRNVFFQGKRDIPLSKNQRYMMLTSGINGLLENYKDTDGLGIWKYLNIDAEKKGIDNTLSCGGYTTKGVFALDNYLNCSDNISYDSNIGSIGGGNHFVELQYINKIYNYDIAQLLGLHEGDVLCMVHSGSLGFGQITGKHFIQRMKERFPKGKKHPKNGIYILPTNSDDYNVFITSMYNAANFAFCNRMFLSLMVKKVLHQIGLNSFKFDLIYDAPHNFIWSDNDNYMHRKGATSANSFYKMNDTMFKYYGEPVIIPGSMGSSSYLLTGKGNDDFLSSACHGAGRGFSRGDTVKINDDDFNTFLNEYNLVTPVDFKSNQLKHRNDILKKIINNIKQESPFAYKNVTPVIKAIEDAGIADKVFELKPFITVKGF